MRRVRRDREGTVSKDIVYVGHNYSLETSTRAVRLLALPDQAVVVWIDPALAALRALTPEPRNRAERRARRRR
jgi:hypothetical protein